MIDKYGRDINYLRVSITDLCNLRCRYCMPAEGVVKKSHDQMLSEEELINAIQAFCELGVTKIRLTGGEPLVKNNILSIIENIRNIPGINEICLTTNGILLEKMADDLKAAGIDRINVSLDTLDEKKFSHITRGGDLKVVLRGLDKAKNLGFSRIKINNVLIGGFNDDETSDFVNMTRDNLDVRFIELMPMSSDCGLENAMFLDSEFILKNNPKLVEDMSKDETGNVKYYKIPGFSGRVGLISPMSHLFCANCNRMRITADGIIKPCLHSADEISIKGLPYKEMRKRIEESIYLKPKERPGLIKGDSSPAGRTMSQIGG